MSTEARRKLAERLEYTNRSSQRADILDTSKTNTYLIDFLTKVADTCGHPILITALNSDHAPGTYHNTAGRAVDCWIADWQQVGDDKIVDLMSAAGKVAATGKPTLVEVGLSGTAIQFKTWVTWPPNCYVFAENTPEHVHFAVGVPS